MEKTKYLLFLVLLPLVFTAGCIRGQATVSLNPDGSGKIVFEALVDPCGIEEQPDVRQTHRNIIAEMKDTLLKSEGIDAWTGVDWRIFADGKFYFKGEAFFESLNDVTIYFRGTKCSLKAFYLTDESKRGTLVLKSQKSEPNEETEYTKRRDSERRYELFSSDIKKILTALKLDLVFILPANPEMVKGFDVIDSKTVRYSFDGNRMIYLLDFIRSRGLYNLAERWSYNKSEFLNNELMPLYLSRVSPLMVYFADTGSDIFDYKKEKSAVQKEILSIIDRLDADAVTAKIKQNQQAKSEEQPAFEPAPKAKPDTGIDLYLRDGLVLEAKGEYEQAVEIYSKIIADKQTEPKYLAQGYYRKGMCLFEMGETDKALEQFEYVITNFPMERAAAVRSSKMIFDINNGTAVRKAEKPLNVPMIVSLSPDLYYVEDANFGLDSITVRFSVPMQTSSWYYSSLSPGLSPQITGEPSFDQAGISWTLPVKLEPGKVYAIAFNCGDAVKDTKMLKAGFRDLSGKICKPFVLVFATMDEDNVPTKIGEELVIKSEEINTNSEK